MMLVVLKVPQGLLIPSTTVVVPAWALGMN
jgi:hypothetical protein